MIFFCSCLSFSLDVVFSEQIGYKQNPVICWSLAREANFWIVHFFGAISHNSVANYDCCCKFLLLATECFQGADNFLCYNEFELRLIDRQTISWFHLKNEILIKAFSNFSRFIWASFRIAWTNENYQERRKFHQLMATIDVMMYLIWPVQEKFPYSLS